MLELTDTHAATMERESVNAVRKYNGSTKALPSKAKPLKTQQQHLDNSHNHCKKPNHFNKMCPKRREKESINSVSRSAATHSEYTS